MLEKDQPFRELAQLDNLLDQIFGLETCQVMSVAGASARPVATFRTSQKLREDPPYLEVEAHPFLFCSFLLNVLV